MLDWEGRAAVEDCHLAVPYQLVHCNGALSAGDKNAGNLLVQGDNLAALKALLPYYGGKVKCVYIDPPYNTGKEGWAYSDRVDSPVIRHWLGKVVGEENADLTRHDKWLCMMYPRLKLLREFLREDGIVGVFCDNNEQHNLRHIMDDIFGVSNFRTTFLWKKKGTSTNVRSAQVSAQTDYIHVYAKSDAGRIKPRVKTSESRAYPLSDGEGNYRLEIVEKRGTGAYRRETMRFEILGQKPRAGKRWQIGREKARVLESKGRFIIDAGIVKLKIYEHEDKDSFSAWPNILEGYGSSDSGEKTLSQILGQPNQFDNPKPPELLQYLIGISSDEDSLILDSFAGSGTTGHAVLALNKEGGNRQFILVEMEKDICEKITARRLRKVIGKDGDGLGGGFRYCTLGRELFDEYGQIASEVKFADLAAHIFFSETGVPIPKKAGGKSPLLGEFNGKAVYLLFQGAEDGKVLDPMTLRSLPQPKGKVSERVVYGESCALTERRLAREGIVFRKIPWEVQGK